MDTPTAVILGLLVALVGLWALTEGGSPEAESPVRAAPVAVIAERVEALRDLRFRRVPEPVAVTPEQATREGLADLDRSYPEARRRADERILTLLGLIEPGVSLRELSASIFGEGVAGYYDPRAKRLRIVEGAEAGSRVLAEIILAHELTHALEDQRFDLRVDELSGSDDSALAYLGLVEGTATALMLRYAERHFTREETLGGLAASAFQETGSLPPFIQAQLVFPYVGGQAFVDELLRRAGGRWDLVDTAYRVRPPASTEQVLHPEAYFAGDAPQRVRLRLRPVLGARWRRRAAGAFGELQTRELLAAAGGGGSADAAEGWGGDRYELWRSAAGADVLVMRWRWDSERDADEFAAKLPDVVEHAPDGAAIATARRAGGVTLAFAPTRQLARRAARAAG